MIAKERGRRIKGVWVALAALGVIGMDEARAQQQRPSAAGRATAKAAAQPVPAADADGPRLVLKAIPVNPTDAIATVNNQVVTRQQLNDECVARKGEEILDTLINRMLIEQALKANKLDVTAAEIDQEIENVAQRMAGIGREAWLRTLDKERGISPIQYARDIIFPALALRKLSARRVQVTEKDLNAAFESQYGDKLRCRLIMLNNVPKAREVWEKLRAHPGSFEKLAQDYSMDTGSRSLGGLLAEPITRHASPQTVSDAAFTQLVDGDPSDKDPGHKPKDGDFTGPIQVAEATWVILKREGVIPANHGKDGEISLKNEAVRKQMYELIYEVKLKDAMSECFIDLMQGAAIDNKLTGHVKLAHEEQHPEHRADRDVKLMSNPDGAAPAAPVKSGKPAASGPVPTGAAPVGAPKDDVLSKQTEALRNAPIRK